tara:strand:- start:97 stop:654 length:558 start_codon:yes stop_codon:yes gene_type:complete
MRAEIIKTNPLAKIKRLKHLKKELSFLNLKECKLLLDVLRDQNYKAYLVAKICLSTGTRWSEAVNLKSTDVKNNQIHVLGKNNKIRYLNINEELAQEIKKCPPNGVNQYKSFARILTQLKLKKSEYQLTHLLRHTFASHFIMNTGNILALQKILDHSSLNVTMQYAHLSSDFLEEMITKNPVSNL